MLFDVVILKTNTRVKKVISAEGQLITVPTIWWNPLSLVIFCQPVLSLVRCGAEDYVKVVRRLSADIWSLVC